MKLHLINCAHLFTQVYYYEECARTPREVQRKCMRRIVNLRDVIFGQRLNRLSLHVFAESCRKLADLIVTICQQK